MVGPMVTMLNIDRTEPRMLRIWSFAALIDFLTTSRRSTGSVRSVPSKAHRNPAALPPSCPSSRRFTGTPAIKERVGRASQSRR